MEVQNETIFAVASGAGRAAVAVIRLSGPHAKATLAKIAGRLPPPRRASLARLCDPDSGELIDQGLALWFPAPASFTGEDCAEFQVHGSRAVVAALIQVLSRLAAHRLAEPGEFARRAFLNGRMDLAQIEGLADLVDTQTEYQRRHALVQLEGVLGQKTEVWRRLLLQALVLAEAEIDFVDEGDAPTLVLPKVCALIGPVISGLESTIKAGSTTERLRDGFLVVICGAPNVGKSTFLNHIANRDVALVSEHPGTTRDILEIFLDMSGMPVRLVDTAGLRTTDNPIEQQGIAKAQRYIADADLILWLQETVPTGNDGLPSGSRQTVWTVQTKIDVPGVDLLGLDHAVSSATGAGVAGLLDAIGALAQQYFGSGAIGAAVRERHLHVFAETLAALRRAVEPQPMPALELVAEDVRMAARSLGRVTGSVDVEMILGEIFARFCLGK